MDASRGDTARREDRQACLRSARPNFLVLAPLCAGLAVLTARLEGAPLARVDTLLVLLAALLAHAAVNLLNEHHDFASGLDATTRRTPFSGGSGALPGRPAAAPLVWRAAVACLAGVVVIGSWFLWRSGPWLLPYGLLGLGLVVAYTGVLTHRPLLCLLAPGLGFGVLMVVGAHQALTGHPSSLAMTVSLVPTLLVSALLLLNQVPDIDADRRVGRRHLAILLGRRRAVRLAGMLVLAAFLVVPAGVAVGLLPAATWLTWLLAPAVAWLVRGLWRLNVADVAALVPWLGANVALQLGTLALLNLGLWLAG
ncbi:prenyltransferase [Halomonas stenophila]|uniref:1,4-dihydroxy-2-naphthoate octaprenyltransferase n=1 Tax=Halomonas stenophila TaxID=795312 RepID=A0A7W5ETA4_9GAMM|nr:prenyltransferase [Halomonas stenophila]MBB3230916.1 1,4-dihydroxy-2-naphthoate octaprenyltransferase [Halomonas stenophila]